MEYQTLVSTLNASNKVMRIDLLLCIIHVIYIQPCLPHDWVSLTLGRFWNIVLFRYFFNSFYFMMKLYELLSEVYKWMSLTSIHHCPRLGESWAPANMFNPACVPVPSQDTVIQWFSFLAVYHIWFWFIVLCKDQAVSFFVWIVLHLSFRGLL